MEKETTVDQGSSRWSNKVLAFIFISLLFGSNILNSYINTQYHHGLMIDANDEAARRRLTHGLEKLELKLENKDLKKELEECKNN